MARRIRHTVVLPPPIERLSPARAVRWLRHDYRRWAALVGTAHEPLFDPATRRALGSLSMDLVAIVEACAAAIERGHVVRLALVALKREPFDRHTRDLRRIVLADAYLREHGIYTGLGNKLRRAERRRQAIGERLRS